MRENPLELIQEVARQNVPTDSIPNPEKGIGRNCLALSDTEDAVMVFLKGKVEKLFAKHKADPARYHIKNDAFGNLFVTLYGTDRDAKKTVMSGSHIDSVKDGGIYDGIAGVSSALHFLEYLLETKQAPECNYRVAIFRSEESSPTTGVACLGSRIATGAISVEELRKINYLGSNGKVVSLQEHFSNRYDALMWDEVEKEVQAPPITEDNTRLFEEVHLGQSYVLKEHDADVGIVVDGIGGARREQIIIPPEMVRTEKARCDAHTPHYRFIIEFTGQEAHTGGTPPNFYENRIEGNGRWYRSDALVAACTFLENLLDSTEIPSDAIKVTRCSVPEKTGFTTVPKKQIVELCVPETHVSTVHQRIEETKRVITKNKGVEIASKEEMLSPGEIVALDPSQLRSAIHIPLAVEKTARLTVQRQGGVGKTRATVTDFILDPEEGMQWNIDHRSVDEADGREVVERVDDKMRQELETFGIDLESVRTILSDKSFNPVDEGSAEIKAAIAESLGYTYVRMPSIPGQDAGSMSAKGIPSTMTFIRDNGVSHSPREDAEKKHYVKAERLSHAFLARELGVEL